MEALLRPDNEQDLARGRSRVCGCMNVCVCVCVCACVCVEGTHSLNSPAQSAQREWRREGEVEGKDGWRGRAALCLHACGANVLCPELLTSAPRRGTACPSRTTRRCHRWTAFD